MHLNTCSTALPQCPSLLCSCSAVPSNGLCLLSPGGGLLQVLWCNRDCFHNKSLDSVRLFDQSKAAEEVLVGWRHFCPNHFQRRESIIKMVMSSSLWCLIKLPSWERRRKLRQGGARSDTLLGPPGRSSPSFDPAALKGVGSSRATQLSPNNTHIDVLHRLVHFHFLPTCRRVEQQELHSATPKHTTMMVHRSMSLVAGLLLCLAALAHAQEYSGAGPCTTQGELPEVVNAFSVAL